MFIHASEPEILKILRVLYDSNEIEIMLSIEEQTGVKFLFSAPSDIKSC